MIHDIYYYSRFCHIIASLSFLQHQRQYDDATASKVQTEVLQVMTETAQVIRTEVAAGADNSSEAASPSCNMRVGNEYVVCPDTIDSFRSGGLTILENLLTEQEMKDLEVLYDKHMTGKYMCMYVRMCLQLL